jgi:hypothetical protein
MELEKSAEQVLPGSGVGVGWGGGRDKVEAGAGGKGGEMTQTMYAHVNK